MPLKILYCKLIKSKLKSMYDFYTADLLKSHRVLSHLSLELRRILDQRFKLSLITYNIYSVKLTIELL